MADVRKAWNKIARHYHRRYEISTDTIHYGPLCPGEDKLGLMGDLQGREVVDLGCGCGQNAIALAKAGARVTAIDFAEEQIQQARQSAQEHGRQIDFHAADISDLTFLSDSKFDLAISSCAISFVESPESVFSEIYRILKTGGIFILADMNPLQYILDENEEGVEFNHRYPSEPFLIKWGWEFDELANTPRFQHYVRSIPEYVNKLIESGFVIEKILEPQSTIDTPHLGFSREIMDEYKYIADNIPITFIIQCRKP